MDESHFTRAAQLAVWRVCFFLAVCLLVLMLPCAARAASNHYLDPGRYDVGSYKIATNLHLNKSGTYTLTGSSSKVMVYVAEKGGSITLELDGLTLTPNESAPGVLCRRSAITVADVAGGSVRILARAGTTSTLQGWSEAPALCKTGLKTALSFDGGGTLVARADSGAFRTAAIGSAETESIIDDVRSKFCFGNVTFNNIIVYAYGSGISSKGWWGRGGPAIGASFAGYVDGIVFNDGCEIYAYAGAADAAAIGTASGSWMWNPAMVALGVTDTNTPCKNVTINGGTIVVGYQAADRNACFGAGIGGGSKCSADNLTINGGSVTVTGDMYNPESMMWATGIGAGADENANNITITGGTVVAWGNKTGIGGGYSEGVYTDAYVAGDCHVQISGGDVTALADHGVGIGGWAGDLPTTHRHGNGTVTISGGRVTATGGNGCGIGGGGAGWLAAVNISGGTVIAKSSTINPSRDSFSAIGCNHGPIETGRLNQLSITGGTVVALESSGSIGRINANAIYISGGSIYASADNVTAFRGGPAVARNEINLAVWNTPVRWQDVSLRSLTISPLGYEYNAHDIIPMKQLLNAADFHLWLPDGASVECVSVQPGILEHKSTEFAGRAGLSQNDNTLYPAIRATLHADKTPGAADKVVLIKYLSSRTEILLPPVKAGRTITGYTFQTADKAMETDGTFLSIPGYASGTPPLWQRNDQATYQKGVDFYAMWEDTVYTFRFAANPPANASTAIQGETPDKTCKYTQSILPVNGYRLSGYTFAGWNTRADGTGAYYRETDALSPQALGETEDLGYTLYACWSPKEYTVTFLPGIGSGTMPDQQMVFDQPKSIDLNAFTPPANMVFAGWQRKHVTGSRLYGDGAVACNLCNRLPDGSVTGYALEAQWVDERDFTVLLILNDAPLTLAPDRLALRGGDASVFKPFAFGAFEGSYVCAAGSLPGGEYTLLIDGLEEEGVLVNPAEGGVYTLRYCSVEMTADEHAAAWIGAVGRVKMEAVRVGSALRIGASVDAGHRFEAFTAVGSQPLWQQGDPTLIEQTVTITGQALITAHPDAVSYSVRFLKNSDSAAGAMPLQDMRYGEPQTLFANAFTRKGYAFARWAARADGSGASYAPGQRVLNLTAADGAVIDLYAVWQPVSYTVRFDANGALGSMGNLSCVYDQPAALPVNRFFLLGSDFLYWNTEKDNTGTVYKNGASCLNLSDKEGAVVTLYAQWAHTGYGPWVLRQPEDVTIYEGADATFAVEGGGLDPVTYQWQRDDGTGWRTIDGETGRTLTLYGVPRSASGARFRAQVINGDGQSLSSDSALLTVIALPPQTGDAAAPALWHILLLISALCLTVVCRLNHRKKSGTV